MFPDQYRASVRCDLITKTFASLLRLHANVTPIAYGGAGGKRVVEGQKDVGCTAKELGIRHG